jgi:hypothetical protein
MLRRVLILATALGCFSFAAVAQTQPDKKTDAKGKEDPKSKAKEAPKGKISLGQMKFPKDAIVVVVDNLFDAIAIFPDMVLLSEEKYAELQEQITTLKQQLKGSKKTPFSCKLHGKLEDDFLICRAEFIFSTEQPKTIVSLGLNGGHLLGVGELDSRPPILEVSDDGFSVRVEKEGDHQLVLNFRVPATVKKSITGGIERGIKLKLAETAITIVNLELPANVKELRCNDALEKTKTPGRWLIGLEKSKELNLAWKEPAPLSGNAVPKAEGQIAVQIDAKDVILSTKLFLQDPRMQTTEWRIVAPPNAEVKVDAPPSGLKYDLIAPAGNKTYYTLTTPQTAERWTVAVSLTVPRPNPGPRVPIGPLQVLGVQQTGTITVTMPANVSLGQRLVFTRTDALRQLKNTDTEAVFEYVLAKNPKPAPTAKAPLELEWRFEKNQAKTEVEHLVKLRAVNQGWEIDATTKIKVTALFSAVNAIDIKLPQPFPRGMSLLGTAAPGLPFPGSLPWPGIWKTLGTSWTHANADDFTIFEEGNPNPLKPAQQDATGKTRVLWERGPAKQITVILKNTYRVPAQDRHIRLELPRPLNTQDRGAKLSIQADERIELLHGPAGADEPVPDRDRFEQTFDQAPNIVELTWRPFQREIVAQATIDINLHEHSAQVRQTLRFPRPRLAAGSDVKNPLIELVVPLGIDKPTATGGEIITYDRARRKAWLRADADSGDVDVVLHYDLAVKDRRLIVTPIWPADVSQKDVKLRVWAPAGVQTRLTDDTLQRGVWKERSIEVVPEKKHFPALVLVGYGANLPLALQIQEAAANSLAAFLADRALIQVQMAEDGRQRVQARYLIGKLNADFVEVELPLPLSHFRDRPTFTLGKDSLSQWNVVDATGKVVRVQLHPDQAKLPAVLEINYTIPAEGMERTSFWRTTLHAPIFRSEVVIGQMRWQLSAPTPQIAGALGRDVRPDVQWGLQGWLPTPEPSVTAADLDGWLTGKEAAHPAGAVTFAFSHVGLQPETVYHLPRQWWLLGCSGIFLIVALGTYLAPLPRWVFWLLVGAFSLGVVAFAVLCPAASAPVLFGMQPGVVLLLVFIGVHLLLQEKYRRQLVFLPGFTRAKPNSTIVRSSSAAKRPREASTVDAPPGAPGSVTKSAGSQAGS